MNLDVLHLVCNGYTKFPPSDKEVKKNSKDLSKIFCRISDSILNNVMHYTTAKQVWEELHEIHEEVPKEDSSSNILSNNVSKMTDGVLDSKEDRLEEFFLS